MGQLLLLMTPLGGWAQAPTLSGFSPASGAVGTTLTLTGSSLTGTQSVRFGEVPARFTVRSRTEVTVTVPRLASTSKLRLTTSRGTVLTPAALSVTRASASFPAVTSNFNGINVSSLAVPAFADLNGDGLLDMLVGKNDGMLSHYKQSAPNSLSFTLVTASFNGIDVGDQSAPTFTDLNGDGLLDLLIGGAIGRLNHYRQSAAGSTTFVLVTPFFNSFSLGQYCQPTFTDVDGDGLLDLVVGIINSRLVHYEQNAPTPPRSRWFPTPLPALSGRVILK